MMLEIKTSKELQDIFDEVCFCSACNLPEASKKWVSVDSLNNFIFEMSHHKSAKVTLFKLLDEIGEDKDVHNNKIDN